MFLFFFFFKCFNGLFKFLIFEFAHVLCTFLFFCFWWQCNLEIGNLVCQTGGVFHFGCCTCLGNAILEILSLLFVLVA